MENSNTCSYCEKTYPSVGYFCGGCLNQFKCKSCDTILEKDSLGCTMCGEPKDLKRESPNLATKNANTFRLHESLNERTIEATFSDNVGKEFAGILSDSYQSKIKNIETLNLDSADSISSDNIVEIEASPSIEEHVSINDLATKEFEYPTLKVVTLKNLPSTETEWVLVYSFYASNFGTSTFERQNILEKHLEANRKNNNYTRDLSSNIRSAVKSGYINVLQNEYFLFEKGVEKAKEIIARTIGTVPKVKSNNTKLSKDESSNFTDTKNKTTSNSEVKSLKILSNIDFFPDNLKSLKDFCGEFNHKNDYERILLFTYYLEEILKIKPITSSHIYTCFDTINLPIPQNLPQTIRNAKSSSNYIDKENESLIVSVKGRNKIKFWDKK